MGLIPVVIIIVSCLPLLVVLFVKWRYTYWTRKGLAQLNPEFFYGDLRVRTFLPVALWRTPEGVQMREPRPRHTGSHRFLKQCYQTFNNKPREMLIAKISLGGAFRNIYSTLKNKKLKYGGVYWSLKPVFVPVDLQLIKEMTLKSFSHFQDRGFQTNEKDVLTNHLFRMRGNRWKELRVKLTPTFTSSKMRMMFETLCEKIVSLETAAKECIEGGGKINVTDLSARFTTDVIGSCAFGIECDSLKDPDCEFRVYGKKINVPRRLKQWIENTLPRNVISLLYNVGYRNYPEVEDFFRNIVAKTIEHREKNGVFRKDFLHLLLQLRNRGVLSDDGNITKEGQKGILTDDEVVAQCFLFFAAGFDTSSATTAFALYELAQHQDIQDKVREEMKKVFNKYDGKLTYEGAKELVYTEKVISETLRKYPVLPAIPRICTKNYQLPGTDIVIEKGTSVQIPAWGIHMDPEYYPNPEEFDPERFSDEAKAKRPEFSYLAFGEGPRNCIGARFGMVQVKVGLCGFLRDKKYTLLPETPKKMSFKPSILLLHPVQEICLRIEKV